MVRFHEHADDSLLRFAVICARYQNQWLLVRHRERRTWECPGGHREPGEDIDATARRELWEETGALVRLFRRHPSRRDLRNAVLGGNRRVRRTAGF